MRKGEKLHRFLESKMDECESSSMLSPSANVAAELGYALDYLRDMKDDEFDDIIMNKTDVSKNEIVCSLCNGITYYFGDPLTQEDIDNFVCVCCEDAVKDKILFFR